MAGTGKPLAATSPRQLARAQSPLNAPVATAFLLLARSFFVLKLNFVDHLLDFDACAFCNPTPRIDLSVGSHCLSDKGRSQLEVGAKKSAPEFFNLN